MNLRVLGIPGSLRRGSYNRRLLEAAVELAPHGLTIELTDLAAIPPFDEDLEPGPDAVRALRGQVRDAAGLLIATPEYNQSFPGVLKNAIDWLSRPAPDEPLAQKRVALIGATPGRWGTRLAQAGLRQVLVATEALVLVTPALFVAEAGSRFGPDGRLHDAPTRAALGALLAAFKAWIS